MNADPRATQSILFDALIAALFGVALIWCAFELLVRAWRSR